MSQARAQAMRATLDGEFVIFLIGMRINQPWRIDRWLPVLLAMPHMLRELYAQPELGFLGAMGGPAVMVQYWRSEAQLLAYARSREHAHLPAWAAFNRRAKRSAGAVGIWHETYRIAPGSYEALYVATPPRGLGLAGRLEPV